MHKILTKKAATLSLFLATLFFTLSTKAQINITANVVAQTMAQTLAGSGVTVFNAVLNCPTNASGTFGVNGTTNLGIDSGVILTCGRAATTTGQPGANGAASLFPSYSLSAPGDAQLNAIAGVNTYDRCALEFDFLPTGDTIKFNYVFSSEEYFGYSCSSFNDVFGFFLSGPGIVGSKNLAVIPGTNIPITVNSTTNPTITNATGSISVCQAMGTGSPFSQYFVDNSNGTTVTHNGFTKVFLAVSTVIPCSTYHLKLAIADGSDGILDSGTWIKAGSLTSNAINIKGIGGAGLSNPRPYCVRGCLPGTFLFNRPSALSTPLTIKYQIVGTAVNGTDYVQIPDSVIILAGATQATRTITAVPIFPAAGLKTVKLRVFNPYACSANQIIDSAELDIYDSLYVKVFTNDTAICVGETINLDGEGDPILSFEWIPNTGVANPTSLHTTVTPPASQFYALRATLKNSGCPPAHEYVQVWVRETPTVDIGPDRTTCLNTPVQLNVSVAPQNQPYTYTWTPAVGLSSPSVQNPVANPLIDQTYTVTVNPGAIGCDGTDQILVRVLPNDFTFDHKDTAICRGDKIQIRASGHTEFNYSWTPTNGVSNPFIIDPELKPDTSDTYVVTARYPNCPDMVHSFHIDVQPVPTIDAGMDREMCQWDSVHLHAKVAPGWYTQYDYSWTPANALAYGQKEKDAVFFSDNTTDMKFIATTPAGCKDSDIVNVIVYPGDFAKLEPEGPWAVCPNDSIHFKAEGGILYDWSPNEFISKVNTPEVTVYPTTMTAYTLYVTNANKCRDTFIIPVRVHPEAIAKLGGKHNLHPGESVQLDPLGNCLYFDWFPRVGLSAYNISNPVASPEVNTRYIVHATTENGCVTTDSVDIYRVETEMNMPNAFTPRNGNELKIIKEGIATLKYFRIFNRWGVKMFETNDVNKGWDGTFNGEPQPVGVYVYSIEAIMDSGKPFVKQGNVTLIR